jgi:hypothetical protein
MKAEDLTKQACENAIKKYTEKQVKIKEYWDKKMKEVIENKKQ